MGRSVRATLVSQLSLVFFWHLNVLQSFKLSYVKLFCLICAGKSHIWIELSLHSPPLIAYDPKLIEVQQKSCYTRLHRSIMKAFKALLVARYSSCVFFLGGGRLSHYVIAILIKFFKNNTSGYVIVL